MMRSASLEIWPNSSYEENAGKSKILDDHFTVPVVTQPAAYVFRGEELHSLSHLEGEAQEVFIGESLKAALVFIFKHI